MHISKLKIIRFMLLVKLIAVFGLLWQVMVVNESSTRGFDLAFIVAFVFGVAYVRASHKAAKLKMNNETMSKALSIS